MINELKGYIGLSSAASTAESGLYVDALPDISMDFLDKLTLDEGGGMKLWKEIEQRALLRFRTAFIREVNIAHRVNKREQCECLIVSNKDLLATALWYIMGAELMRTRTTSSRMNSYTTILQDKAAELKSHFERQFEQELTTAVNNIDIHQSPCFECKPEGRPLVSFHPTLP